SLRNRLSLHDGTASTAVGALPASLSVSHRAEHKESNHNRTNDFKRFCFHIVSSVKISEQASQTDARCGKFKKVLNSCAAIRPAFSGLLSRYSFSKTRNLSSSIRRRSPR